MRSFTLTAAELAVLTNTMLGEAFPLDSVTQTDLGAGEAELEAAREELYERGLLVSAPQEQDLGVSGELALLLATTISPDRLAILRTTWRDSDLPPRYFSLTSECIALNYLDELGRHRFAELAGPADLLDQIVVVGVALGGSSPRPGERAPVEELLPEATSLSMLLVVDDPAQAAGAARQAAGKPASAQTFSWLESRGGLWLVEGGGDGAKPQALASDAARLRERIAQSLGL